MYILKLIYHITAIKWFFYFMRYRMYLIIEKILFKDEIWLYFINEYYVFNHLTMPFAPCLFSVSIFCCLYLLFILFVVRCPG